MVKQRDQGRGISVLVRVILCAMLPWSSFAGASEFLATVEPFENCVAASDSPASDGFSNSENGASLSTATATAGPGFATFQVSSSSEGTSTNFAASARTCYAARAIVDDIVISGPTGTVPVQLQAFFNGTLNLDGAGPPAVSVMFARIRVGIVNPVGGMVSWVSTAQFDPSTFGSPLETSISTTLLTPPVDVPTNAPIAIELFVEGRTTTTDTLNNVMPIISTANANFSDGLRLPRNAPVFMLPSGYRADSVDGQIVENEFVGGSPQVPSIGRPSLVLLFACLTWAGWLSFRTPVLSEDGTT